MAHGTDATVIILIKPGYYLSHSITPTHYSVKDLTIPVKSLGINNASARAELLKDY